MAKLESLIVDLQVNTAALKSGLDAANKRLEGFDSKLKAFVGLQSFQAAAQAAGAAAQAVAGFVMRGVEALDAMGKQAQFAGDSVESFSETAYAMRIAGVSSEELSHAMLALGKNMTGAASGGKEQLALFSALGVSAVGANGQVRKSSDVLNDLADVFQKLPTSAAKSQLAIELFGKGGEKMGDALSRGSKGINALKQEVKLFGLTVSGEAAEAANNFNEKMDRLRGMGDSAAQVMASKLIPALDSFVDRLIKSEAAAKVLRVTMLALELGLRGVVGIAEGVVRVVDIMASSFSTARGAMSRLAGIAASAFGGPIIAALVGAKQTADDFTTAVKKARTEVAKTPSKLGVAESLAAKAGSVTAESLLRRKQAILDAQKKREEEIAKATEKRRQAVADLEKTAHGLEAQVRTFDATPFEQVVDSLEHGELAEKLKLAGDRAEELKGKVLGAAEALQKLQDEKLAKQRAFELKTTITAGNRSIDQQERSARQAGMTDEQRVTADLKNSAFGTRGEAVAAQRAAMQRAAEATAAAAEASAKHNDDAARQYQEVAASAQAAEQAAAATAQSFLDAAAIARSKMQSMRDMVISSATNKLGELGNTINAGIQGAQAGGIWGAIIAVILELLTKFSRFQEIIEALNVGLSRILGVLGEFVNTALYPALHSIEYAINSIVEFITPIVNIVGSLFSTLKPIIDAIMALAEAFSPLGYAIQALTPVFNGIALVILGVMRGLYEVWGWIIHAVKDVLVFFGADVTQIVGEIARQRVATDQLDQRIARIANNMMDTNANSVTPPIQTLATAADDAATSINEFSKSLTNVPEGFRYAAAAYNSMDEVGGFAGGQQPTTNITVNGSILTESELADLFDRHSRRNNFRRGQSGANPRDYTR